MDVSKGLRTEVIEVDKDARDVSTGIVSHTLLEDSSTHSEQSKTKN